jgi:hypothetical protein
MIFFYTRADDNDDRCLQQVRQFAAHSAVTSYVWRTRHAWPPNTQSTCVSKLPDTQGRIDCDKDRAHGKERVQAENPIDWTGMVGGSTCLAADNWVILFISPHN